MKDRTISALIGITFWFIFVILFLVLTFGIKDLMKEDLSIGNILNLIMMGAIWYLIFYQISYPLFMWNKRLKLFHEKVLGVPALIALMYSKIHINIGIVIIFVAICIFPTALLISFIPEDWGIKWGVVYIVSLLALMIFSYRYYWIIRFLNYIFESKRFRNPILEYMEKSINYRLYAYVMMIIIYVVYNFNMFSGNFVELDMENDMTILKEVFVTFIAIDSGIQIYSQQKNTKGTPK